MTRNNIIAIILIIVFAVGGFLLGKSVSQNSTQSKTTSPKQNSIFSSQTATIQGEITKVNNGTISVKSNSGQTGDFPLSPRAVIYQFKPGATTASASSDLKTIETGKPVVLVLELKDGTYQVVSISYIQKRPASLSSPSPSPTPIKSGSAKTKK